MDRIIVARYMDPVPAEKLNVLRTRIAGQLPPEGFQVIVVPCGVEVMELGTKEPIPHVLAEEPAQTPGAAGREVQHVDAPVEDDKIRYMWLTKDECTEEQRAMAVGEHDGRWAITVENCTPDQMAGRGICEL